MWEALQLTKDLVPVCDRPEELGLLEAQTVQMFASLLATVMPCPIVHFF